MLYLFFTNIYIHTYIIIITIIIIYLNPIIIKL
jgi:hypothetical protein